jgi:Fe-S cluster assembly iron-binding protein IscA
MVKGGREAIERSGMLSITTTAEQAIDSILSTTSAPEEAGVRIEAQGGDDGEEAGFQLAVVAEPVAGDDVIADGNVFIEPTASQLLAESELDADVEAGEVTFKLQHKED